MRYHYEKPTTYCSIYGTTYLCSHPVYSKCTLFEINGDGLAIIQQRFNPETKTNWWDEIDPWLTDSIYLHKEFKKFLEERAGVAVDGLYTTVTIRQIMWALKTKPMKREQWETCFDRREI